MNVSDIYEMKIAGKNYQAFDITLDFDLLLISYNAKIAIKNFDGYAVCILCVGDNKDIATAFCSLEKLY